MARHPATRDPHRPVRPGPWRIWADDPWRYVTPDGDTLALIRTVTARRALIVAEDTAGFGWSA